MFSKDIILNFALASVRYMHEIDVCQLFEGYRVLLQSGPVAKYLCFWGYAQGSYEISGKSQNVIELLLTA